jgi:hypothetical protein
VIDRRDFLLLRTSGRGRSVELSCERLLMKFVDSTIDASTSQLFARLEDELSGVRSLRLVDAAWLTREDFRNEVDRVIDRFRKRGGLITVE